MMDAPLPADEKLRVAALRSLNLLDTPAEERFDRITRLAQRLFGVPIALVSLVAADRQWHKSAQGLAAREFPRRGSFCAHAILSAEPLVVPDASRDPRFSGSPLVAQEGVRFYAGHPLGSPEGARLGTLCVMDRQPRIFSSEELASLRDLAEIAMDELQMARLSQSQQVMSAERDTVRRKATLDPVTHVWAPHAIVEILGQELARSRRQEDALSILVAGLERFDEARTAFGPAAGDALLREAAERLRAGLRPSDALGRHGAASFLIVLPGTPAPGSKLVADRLSRRIAGSPFLLPDGEIGLSVRIGSASAGPAGSAQDLLQAASL